MKLLFVCMGNICRSPTAKGVFDHHLRAAGVEFMSESAGTHAYHVGEPPDPRALRMAAALGIDIGADRARQITRGDFLNFDRIFAMDRDNLQRLQRMSPPQASARLQLVMELAPDYGVDEVPDPYYGGEAGFRQVLDMLEAAARRLLAEVQPGGR